MLVLRCRTLGGWIVLEIVRVSIPGAIMKLISLIMLGAILLQFGCGPTAEEQHAADQQHCADFGYQAGTDAFANCMMKLDAQREAQAAADRRAAAAQAAADQKARQVQQAAKDKAAQDTVNNGTDSSASPSIFGPSPVDDIRNKVQQDIQNIENSN